MCLKRIFKGTLQKLRKNQIVPTWPLKVRPKTQKIDQKARETRNISQRCSNEPLHKLHCHRVSGDLHGMQERFMGAFSWTAKRYANPGMEAKAQRFLGSLPKKSVDPGLPTGFQTKKIMSMYQHSLYPKAPWRSRVWKVQPPTIRNPLSNQVLEMTKPRSIV